MRKSGRERTTTHRPISPKKSPAAYTAKQREQLQRGLRILARMIVRAHLRREASRAEPPPPEPTADNWPLAEPLMRSSASATFRAFPWSQAILARPAPYHKIRPNVIPCKALCSTNSSRTMEC